MVKISVSDVSKIFKTKKKETVALEQINLQVESGESFGIVGPSGAGKTTLMRIIAGLDVPTAGEVRFGDKLMSHAGRLIVPPEKRHIGMVFQNWALYPNLTAFENIAFPLRSEHMEESKIKEKVEETAEKLGIGKVISHFPRELSGGQQQRVSLARALVKTPSILILDEPFSNLDAAMRDSARAMVKSIQQELGVTTLIVSHDPADIFSIAAQAGVLLNGQFQQVDSPLKIYNDPASLSVSRLVGEIISVNGTYVKEQDVPLLKCGDLRFELETDKLSALESDDQDKIEFGFRPEDVKVSRKTKLEGYENAGKVRIKVSSYSGGAFKVVVSPLSDDTIELYAFNEVPFDIGTELYFLYKKDRIKIFKNDIAL
jgi:glucose/arabinose transport system ATP-binding protein